MLWIVGDIIDYDLGDSGGAASWRAFGRRCSWTRPGDISVSRLARSPADWHRPLDLSGLSGAVPADKQAAYTSCDYHDRLLLGLKGTRVPFQLPSTVPPRAILANPMPPKRHPVKQDTPVWFVVSGRIAHDT